MPLNMKMSMFEEGEGRCVGAKKRKRESRAMEASTEPTSSISNTKTKRKNGDEKDLAWVNSLSDSQLDLMMSIKEVAKERMINSGGKYLEGSLPPRALQALGVILEELAKYHAKAILSESHNTSV